MTAKRKDELLHAVTPVWQIALQLAKSVPETSFDLIPKDFAQHHDHYLYGTPKEQ